MDKVKPLDLLNEAMKLIFQLQSEPSDKKQEKLEEQLVPINDFLVKHKYNKMFLDYIEALNILSVSGVSNAQMKKIYKLQEELTTEVEFVAAPAKAAKAAKAAKPAKKPSMSPNEKCKQQGKVYNPATKRCVKKLPA